MKNLNKIIYQKLINNTDITSKADEIFHMQNDISPEQTQNRNTFISFYIISNTGNSIPMRSGTFQINIWSRNIDTVGDLESAVLQEFNKTKGSEYNLISLDSSKTTYDREAGFHGVIQTYRISLFDQDY